MPTTYAIRGCAALLCGAMVAPFAGAQAGTAFVFNTITLPDNAAPTFIDDSGRVFAKANSDECYTWTKGVVKHFYYCPSAVSGNGSFVYSQSSGGGVHYKPKGGRRGIVRIPGLHTGQDGTGYGINNSGYAVGVGGKGGWLWLGTEAQSYLLPKPDGQSVLPYAINDNGEIVGVSGLGPFAYQNGTYTYFLSGSAYSPTVVTDDGTIGGTSYDSGSFIGSVAKGFTELPEMALVGIGPNDEAVGISEIWENGRYHTINYPGTTSGTFIRGVNNQGTITGYYTPDGHTITPFYATCSSPNKICTK